MYALLGLGGTVLVIAIIWGLSRQNWLRPLGALAWTLLGLPIGGYAIDQAFRNAGGFVTGAGVVYFRYLVITLPLVSPFFVLAAFVVKERGSDWWTAWAVAPILIETGAHGVLLFTLWTRAGELAAKAQGAALLSGEVLGPLRGVLAVLGAA